MKYEVVLSRLYLSMTRTVTVDLDGGMPSGGAALGCVQADGIVGVGISHRLREGLHRPIR